MRLFVGLPVSCGDVMGPVRNTLQRLDGVRPAPEGSEHVTLRFFGDVTDLESRQAIEANITKALEGCPAMEGAISRLGMFQDPRHARIVWANLEAKGLSELQERIVKATHNIGQPEAERQFVPHVTLARCKQPQDLRSLHDEYPGPFWEGSLRQVALYESRPGPQGPHYQRLHTWTLAEP